MLTEWQAGKHPLPSATAFLWSHLLCKIAVLFTRNCYQRRGQKNDHMHRAADLCFLYLHVSQNNALYRNTEKRPLQTSSRTEGFVFRLHIKVGRTQFSCKNAAWHTVLYESSAAHFLLNAQSVCLSNLQLQHAHRRMGKLNLTQYSQAEIHSRIWSEPQQNQQQLCRNLNILQQSAQRVEPPVRQRGRPTTISLVWIIICGLFHNMGGNVLFTVECLCSATEQWGNAYLMRNWVN